MSLPSVPHVAMFHLRVPSAPERVAGALIEQMKSQGITPTSGMRVCVGVPASWVETLDGLCATLSLLRDVASREQWPDLVTAAATSPTLRQMMNDALVTDLRQRGDVEACRDYCLRCIAWEPLVWDLPAAKATMMPWELPVIEQMLSLKNEAAASSEEFNKLEQAPLLPFVAAAEFRDTLLGERFVKSKAFAAAAGKRAKANDIAAIKKNYQRAKEEQASLTRRFFGNFKMKYEEECLSVNVCGMHAPNDAEAGIVHSQVRQAIHATQAGTMTRLDARPLTPGDTASAERFAWAPQAAKDWGLVPAKEPAKPKAKRARPESPRAPTKPRKPNKIPAPRRPKPVGKRRK